MLFSRGCLDPTTNFSLPSAVLSYATIHVPNNTPIGQTEAFKAVIYDILEAIPFLAAPISYEPEIVLIRLAELWQELKVAAFTYQGAMPHTNKYLLHGITSLINILNRHFQDQPSLPTTLLNYHDPGENATAVVGAHRDSTDKLPPYLFLSTAYIAVPRIFRP